MSNSNYQHSNEGVRDYNRLGVIGLAVYSCETALETMYPNLVPPTVKRNTVVKEIDASNIDQIIDDLDYTPMNSFTPASMDEREVREQDARAAIFDAHRESENVAA